MVKKKKKLRSKMKKRTIMAGGSAMLKKKLNELESELAAVVGLPLDPKSSGLRLQIHFHDIKQRFLFFNILLQQEIASGQPQIADELHEIGRRFAALQEGFRRWNEQIHSVCSDCTQVLLRGEDMEFSGEMSSPEKLLIDSPVDEMIGSKRDACTQVLPYDDDDRGSDSSSSLGDFSGEKTTEKKGWGIMGKYSGAFGCGMIVGAVCMAKLFFISYSHDNFTQYEALLLPPT